MKEQRNFSSAVARIGSSLRLNTSSAELVSHQQMTRGLNLYAFQRGLNTLQLWLQALINAHYRTRLAEAVIRGASSRAWRLLDSSSIYKYVVISR